MERKCNCGSGLYPYPLYDGYRIFLTFACEQCEESKLEKFRPDIMEHYDAFEDIEPDDGDF